MNIETKKFEVAKIEFNFEEVKKFLEEQMEKYEGLVVTEENKKKSKDDLADLNKIASAIEKYRKEQKKILLEPVDAFEKECKDLKAIVDKVSLPIKEKLNVFEEERRTKKEKEVKKLIEETVEKIGLTIYKDQLNIDDRYLNKSVKKKEIIADLEVRATQIKLQEDMFLNAEKLKKQKIDLIQKEVETKNKEYGIGLKISNYQYLATGDYEITDIPEVIKEEAEKQKKFLETRKELEEKAAPKVVEKVTATSVVKDNFTLVIKNCERSKTLALKEFLANNNYNFELINK